VSEGSEFLHWNGSKWTVFYGPQRFVGYLESVFAISPSDVWAVGYQQVIFDQNTVTLHWDGTRWRLVEAINPQNEAGFYGVTALSSNSVWAVGFQNSKPLVEKWNGRRWAVVSTAGGGHISDFSSSHGRARDD
jgi:hypothetical protein